MAEGEEPSEKLVRLAGENTTTLSQQRVVRPSEKFGLPPGSLVYVGEHPPVCLLYTSDAADE